MNKWLLLLVVICAVSLWFGKDLLPLADGETPSSNPVAETSADYGMDPEEAAIHLVVLNSTGRSGLAREVSLLLGRAGCVAERVGNAPEGKFANSLLVNRSLSDRRAAELAVQMGGIRVIREADERGSEDAVLILGTDVDRLTAALAGKH